MASQDWFEKDFYKVLGVDKYVSQADLKKAYRKLARQYHPDSNPGDAKAEARFKEISEAYCVLSDEEQRQEYDQIRAMGSGARFTAGGAGGAGRRFEDVFGSLFGQGDAARGPAPAGGGGFEDLLGGMFGSGNGASARRRGGFRGFGGPTRAATSPRPRRIDFLTATKGDTVTLQAATASRSRSRSPRA